MPSVPNRFRLQTKNIFLTYSNIQAQQANFSKEQLFEHLKALPFRSSITYLLVGHELHEDGNDHFHATITIAEKCNIRSESFFDFEGVHPNIQSARNAITVQKYCKKDGDFLEWGSSNKYISYLDECDDQLSWYLFCIAEKLPFQYAQSLWSLCKVTPTNTITDPIPGRMCPQLESFTYTGEKPLVLVGPTGCGKTTWVINNAPKPTLLISHLDRLKDLRPGYHQSIIFDDLSFLHLPRESQIHLTDYHTPRDIHVRYRIANIPAGLPKYFTANNRPFIDDPAINRRIHVVNIIEHFV